MLIANVVPTVDAGNRSGKDQKPANDHITIAIKAKPITVEHCDG